MVSLTPLAEALLGKAQLATGSPCPNLEAGGVGGEVDEGAKGEDAVRVVAEDVVSVRGKGRRLAETHWEVVPEPVEDGPVTHPGRRPATPVPTSSS